MIYDLTPEDEEWCAGFFDNLFGDDDKTMVDLGGGMVVPLSELMEDES